VSILRERLERLKVDTTLEGYMDVRAAVMRQSSPGGPMEIPAGCLLALPVELILIGLAAPLYPAVEPRSARWDLPALETELLVQLAERANLEGAIAGCCQRSCNIPYLWSLKIPYPPTTEGKEGRRWGS